MNNASSCLPSGDPDAIARRLIQRAHNQDGLPEIFAGLSFLIIGSFSCAQALVAPRSIPFKAASIALSVLIPVLCIGSPLALKWLRRRYLIHRFGYVASQPHGRKQIRMRITVAVVVAIALIGLVTLLSRPDHWLLAGTGLFGGVLAAMAGQRARFVIGGAIMAATGIILAFYQVPLQAGFAILFGFPGVLALLSGAVVFTRFIRQPIEPQPIEPRE